MTQDERDLDEMLVVRHLSPRKEGETLRQAIDRIVDWDVAAALDPAVSSEAAALVERGKNAAPVAKVADMAATDFRGSRRRDAAEATLQRLGYEWHDGELWKPPLGKPTPQPAQAVALSDRDIARIASSPPHGEYGSAVIPFARAVIAEFCHINGITQKGESDDQTL